MLIAEVFPDTPAAKAGFREGDMILELRRPPGPQSAAVAGDRREVAAGLEAAGRDSARRQAAVLCRWWSGRCPRNSARRRPRARAGGTPALSRLTSPARNWALEVADLTKDLAERLGYAGFSGAVVTAVEPDGPAAQVGIHEGMLMLKVGKKPVASAAEFDAAVRKESIAAGVMLLIRTAEGGNRFVVLRRTDGPAEK